MCLRSVLSGRAALLKWDISQEKIRERGRRDKSPAACPTLEASAGASLGKTISLLNQNHSDSIETGCVCFSVNRWGRRPQTDGAPETWCPAGTCLKVWPRGSAGKLLIKSDIVTHDVRAAWNADFSNFIITGDESCPETSWELQKFTSSRRGCATLTRLYWTRQKKNWASGVKKKKKTWTFAGVLFSVGHFGADERFSLIWKFLVFRNCNFL